MLWEYLECAQNAVGIFKKQFDYQRIYDEFFFIPTAIWLIPALV